MDNLNSLLEKSGSIQEFLSNLVAMVSEQMHSPVCSVYLYDASRDRLILRATQGLHTDLVDRLELEVGEGITGQSFQGSRPIREGRTSSSSFFSPIPGNKQFESFLAVPIRRGIHPIGVITLEHEEANHFTPQDTTLLRAIASQLANIFEDAEFLMELSQDKKKSEALLPSILEGVGVGQGISIGQGIVVRRKAQSFRKMGTGFGEFLVGKIATEPAIPKKRGGNKLLPGNLHALPQVSGLPRGSLKIFSGVSAIP